MQKCTNCGEERKGEGEFCVGCGTPFAEQQTSEKSGHAEKRKSDAGISTGKKKKRIVTLISVGLLMIGIVATHLFFQSKYDPVTKLVDMNQSYVSGEKEEFLSYFEVTKDTAVNAEGFYSFVEEEGWEDIRNQIKTQSTRLKEEGLSDMILDTQGNKLISVIEQPIFGGLYQDVQFRIHPIAVEVEMPLADMSIAAEGKSVKGTEGEVVKLGNFIPGTYQWEANVASAYGNIIEKGQMDISGSGKNKYTYSPELEAAMVSVTSDVPEAILWVNGKSSNKTVSDVKSIGPLPMDGTIELTAETVDDKGGKLKGEKIKVDSDDIHIKFAHVQEKEAVERTRKTEAAKMQQVKEEHEYNAISLVEEFRYSFESALNNADFSYIADYFPTGSQIQEDYLADIDRHYAMETYYYYDFQSNTVTGFDVIDESTFSVTMAEMFYFDSSEDRIKYNKTKAYTVTFENGYYYIVGIDQLTTEKNAV